MFRTILCFTIVFFTFSSVAQEYEIVSKSKEKELLTTETMDSILVKVNELRHPTKIVYYQLSEYTTIKIFPTINQIRKEEE